MWPFFIKALGMFATNLMIALFGEPMIQWVFFKVAHWVVKQTKTTIDDEFVDKLEDNYNKRNR